MHYTSVKSHVLAGEDSRLAIRDPLPKAQTPRLRKSCRSGLFYGGVFTGIVFLLNLCVTIWMARSSGAQSDSGKALFTGSCNTTRTADLVVHLFINVMSTVLLGASNSCMQCLSSPTRAEVDRAHGNSTRPKDLDIGVHSLRNLWSIDRRRVLVWFLLALSSVPLHLFYNSAVFSSVAIYDFPLAVVNSEFLSPTANVHCTDNEVGIAILGIAIPCDLQAASRVRQLALSGTMDQLDPNDCIAAYATDFVTSRGTLVLVLDTNGSISSALNSSTYGLTTSLWAGSLWDPISWMCDQDLGRGSTKSLIQCSSRLPGIKANASGWRPFDVDAPVSYCLSEKLEEQCKLHISLQLMAVVIIFNLAKVVLILYTVFGFPEPRLVTFGDAVASFLQHPDPITEGLCLLSKRDTRRKGDLHQVPRVFNSKPQRWNTTTSRTRWIICILITLLAVGLGLGFYIYSIRTLTKWIPNPTTIASQASLGFGAVNVATLLNWEPPKSGLAGLLSNVLLANMPQLLISAVYLMYNALFTNMALANEWSGFACHRKGLRVSQNPNGQQRSSYSLQLPVRIAMPLMIASATLHWLIASSLFLVDIEEYGWQSKTGLYVFDPNQLSGLNDGKLYNFTCGYSPLPILLAVVLGVGLLVAVILTGFRRLQSEMPVAGSSSLAMSAACHPETEEVDNEDVAERELLWGAIKANVGEVGHCSFSSRQVYPPQHGMLYQ